jgi:hypothetical protein
LSLGEFQEHQFRAVAVLLGMENLSRSKGVSIPAHAPLYIRYFESDMTETNSRDSHTYSPYNLIVEKTPPLRGA